MGHCTVVGHSWKAGAATCKTEFLPRLTETASITKVNLLLEHSSRSKALVLQYSTVRHDMAYKLSFNKAISICNRFHIIFKTMHAVFRGMIHEIMPLKL